MTFRAKFRLIKTAQYHGPYTSGAKILTFSADYDPSIPEDQRFAKATPSGTLEMTMDNPAAVALFEPGKVYYLDFSPAD